MIPLFSVYILDSTKSTNNSYIPFQMHELLTIRDTPIIIKHIFYPWRCHYEP